MENLIKTKKLETRFFLTSAAQQNQGKPQTAAQFTKVKAVTSGNAKEFMNSTAPLNFHNITMMAGVPGGSSTPLNGGILSPGGMMNRGSNPPQSAVGGSRGNSNNSGFNQNQNVMKLSDHIQHNSGTNSSSNVIGESGPAMIGGGGFAFYQTRLTTANPGMKSNAGAGGAGSYFMHNKPGSQMGGMVGGPQSPQSRQGKRYHHQQQHASQQSRQLTQQQQAILLSQGGFNNTTGALPSGSALNNSGPGQGASNLRAKWTRAISGGGGPSEIPLQSPTSNSYRNNKTNNLVINTSGTTNAGLLGTLASSTSPNSIASGQGGYSNNLYKKGGVATAPISPTGTATSFSPNSGLVGVMTPTGNESMPVTIRVKKHKSSKPFLNQTGMTGGPNQQQSAGSSRLGDKTALSNKTDESGPTTTAMDMTNRKKQFNQTQPVINAFGDMPHQSPQEYMQFLEKQQRDMFQKGTGPAAQGPNNGSQPISPVNMNQTQMIINNFFFQPSPKEQSPGSNTFGTAGAAGGTFDQATANGNRNIKTALVQKRQSGTNLQPSSGNAIKPAIEVMRNMLARPEEAPPGNPTSGLPDQVPQTTADQQVPQQEEIIIFSTKTSLDDYIIGKQIGQGAYAIVYIGMHKKSNKKVALKIYLKEKMKEIQRKKSVRREIKLMERLNHPHIAKLYEAIETEDQVVLVMEYVAGGSTHGFLKSKPNRRMDEDDARRIYRQVISALQYCHSKCVCHRDIKLENVMLDAKGNVKIIDFGFSTCIPNDKKIKIFCGTPSYMAPEIVAKKEFCGPPADIWASGVLLFAFFCGCFPFRGQNDKDLYKKIMKCELVIPDHVPSGPRSILAKILQLEPELRPSASELYCDSWVQGINHQNSIVSPMNYQLQQHHMMNQTQQHFGARAAITSGNNTTDMRATTANDPGARNKDRVRSSQVTGTAAASGTQSGFRISSSQVPPNQYHQLQQRGIIAQSPNANMHPSRQQQHQYNQDAFKAYYNTPQGQAEARMSPQGRVNTAPQNQVHIITNNTGNVIMSPTATNHTNGSTSSSNRMLFNFHPGLNPSQEGDMAVKKQTSEKDVVFIAGNGSTSPQHQNAIHPSFVPSLLSSFANTPNNGSQNQNNTNWHSAAVIASQEDSASGKTGVVTTTGPNRVGLPYSNQKQ